MELLLRDGQNANLALARPAGGVAAVEGARAAASSGGAAGNARSATGRRIRGSRSGRGSMTAPAERPAAFRLLWAGLVDDVEGCLGNPAEPRVPGVGGKPLD